MISCMHCGEEISDEPHDTTYSNYTGGNVSKGQHTGNIYQCPKCEGETIDDLLNNVVRPWAY